MANVQRVQPLGHGRDWAMETAESDRQRWFRWSRPDVVLAIDALAAKDIQQSQHDRFRSATPGIAPGAGHGKNRRREISEEDRGLSG